LFRIYKTRLGGWQRKVFFFEKKKQKTFGYFGCGLSRIERGQFPKVFWFFFSKKNMLASMIMPPSY
jgi:hypothetical protein